MGVRLVNEPREGVDYDQSQRIIFDNEGYQYVVGPNEHINSLDDGRFIPAASNATIYYGQNTQQTYAPTVGADFKPSNNGGRN